MCSVSFTGPFSSHSFQSLEVRVSPYNETAGKLIAGLAWHLSCVLFSNVCMFVFLIHKKSDLALAFMKMTSMFLSKIHCFFCVYIKWTKWVKLLNMHDSNFLSLTICLTLCLFLGSLSLCMLINLKLFSRMQVTQIAMKGKICGYDQIGKIRGKWTEISL